MGASFSAELFKLRKRPATWALLAFWLLLNQVFSYLIPYTSYLTGQGSGQAGGGATPEEALAGSLPANMLTSTVGGIPVFAGALALVLGALSMGGEYGHGTLQTVLTQRPRRLSVLGGKVAALAVALLAAMVITFACNALSSWAIAAAEAKPANWPPASDLMQGMAAGWVILLVWSTFGVVLATLLRGVALPIGLGIMWIIGVQNLISGMAAPLLESVRTLQKGLPGANAGSLIVALFGRDDTPGVVSVVGGTQAIITLCAYIVAFTAIAAVSLQRRDVA